MKIYLAPMEGITGSVVRSAFYHNFTGIDRYFTPFIAVGTGMGSRIKRDIAPEYNQGIDLIPQAISTDTQDLMALEKRLMDRGYTEYNLNFGCPSGTVVSKHRGAGFLEDPGRIDAFLEDLFSKTQMKISIKTRIGLSDAAEWPQILEVYQKYPLAELIIHPRLRTDFYKGEPRLKAYEMAYQTFCDGPVSLVYNGDITDLKSYRKISENYPDTSAVMIGRGLLMCPALAQAIKAEQDVNITDPAYRRSLRDFHDEIYDGYSALFSGPRDTIMHMKEIWSYLRVNYPEAEKDMKKLLKTKKEADYKAIADSILGR